MASSSGQCHGHPPGNIAILILTDKIFINIVGSLQLTFCEFLERWSNYHHCTWKIIKSGTRRPCTRCMAWDTFQMNAKHKAVQKLLFTRTAWFNLKLTALIKSALNQAMDPWRLATQQLHSDLVKAGGCITCGYTYVVLWKTGALFHFSIKFEHH